MSKNFIMGGCSNTRLTVGFSRLDSPIQLPKHEFNAVLFWGRMDRSNEVRSLFG